MKTINIAITREAQEQMKEFGTKGESYSEILLKLIKSAKERQLHDLLMDTSNCVTIEEARREAEKKWPRNKNK